MKTATAKKLVKKPATTKAVKTPAKKTVKKPVAKKPVKKASKAVAKKAAKKIAKKTPPKKPAKLKQVAAAAVVVAPPKIIWPALVEGVLKQLDDSKAEQIVAIDLTRKSTMADTMVVASGRSDRHVNAIAEQVLQRLKEMGKSHIRVEGIPQCDWVLVDAGDLVIHVFRPEVRSFYNLEKLWSENAP